MKLKCLRKFRQITAISIPSPPAHCRPLSVCGGWNNRMIERFYKRLHKIIDTVFEQTLSWISRDDCAELTKSSRASKRLRLESQPSWCCWRAIFLRLSHDQSAEVEPWPGGGGGGGGSDEPSHERRYVRENWQRFTSLNPLTLSTDRFKFGRRRPELPQGNVASFSIGFVRISCWNDLSSV